VLTAIDHWRIQTKLIAYEVEDAPSKLELHPPILIPV
jgi:hypothetical protein